MKIIIFTLAILISLSSLAAVEQQRLRAVGSSTLYPFISAIAERFGKFTDYKSPIVEAIGTGSGLKLFCTSAKEGIIALSARKITNQERLLCQQQKINKIGELILGYDGIILASNAKQPTYQLTKRQIFLALAAKIPYQGKLVDNFYTHWQQIDSSLPNKPIEIYLPSDTSGTRVIFNELIMESTCIELIEYINEYKDLINRKQACQLFRDGTQIIEIAKGENLIIKKLSTNQVALGLIGFNFLLANTGVISAAIIEQIKPSAFSIANHSYPLIRPLYIYYDQAELNNNLSLISFISYLTDDSIIAQEGYLHKMGLINSKIQN